MSEKHELRKQVLSRRDALGAAQRALLSEKITARVLALSSYRSARCVMAYMSIGSEFETASFVSDLRGQRKTLVLPRARRGSQVLELYAVRDLERDLTMGVWGIREPRPDMCRTVPLERIDFVLVPGVAFTARCERLGYGGGFYDQLISGFSRRPSLAAAAFGLQIVPELPVSPTDQCVDLVITEDATYSLES
ncbi:MAG: 5-formyltetrahydrofolate cyclo-ligase [Betaproteobacteria bacterium]|nr:5-formyltetrahydrofolate cyclo-ligase [Betaproteobacteria bacterium]MDH3436982.1 5-formyltetrahydrofolate cyclo-ligase [Betaproteobacteria bacterium]